MTDDDFEPRPRGRGIFGAFRRGGEHSREDGSESEPHLPAPGDPAVVAPPHEPAFGAATAPPAGPWPPAPHSPGPTHEDAALPEPEPEPFEPAAPPPAPPVTPAASVAGSQGEALEPETPPPPPRRPDRPAPQVRGEPERDLASRDAAPPLELPRIIALANQKGGVGKTTTAVNLGAGLAELGYRVVVVDLDPQGNATTGLGINPRDVESSIYDVIMNGVSPEDCIEATSLKNLFVLPATIDLAGAEIELVPAFSRELKLKRALDSVKAEYDLLLIDCPPSLGLLTINGLAAADDVIVPIQCEYYALEGLGQLLRNVSLVRSSLNPTLDVRGIVLTMYDARTKLADQVETEVRAHFGAKVYRTVVPRTVRLGEAPSFGQPIIVFDPSSRGATAYRELAKEVSNGAARRLG